MLVYYCAVDDQIVLSRSVCSIVIFLGVKLLA